MGRICPKHGRVRIVKPTKGRNSGKMCCILCGSSTRLEIEVNNG